MHLQRKEPKHTKHYIIIQDIHTYIWRFLIVKTGEIPAGSYIYGIDIITIYAVERSNGVPDLNCLELTLLVE